VIVEERKWAYTLDILSILEMGLPVSDFMIYAAATPG
jgi:hypothetical protein